MLKHQPTSYTNELEKWTVRLLIVTVLLLLLGLTSGCAVFQRRVVVVPADRTVTFLKAGQVVTNDCVGVGVALWRDINEALANKLP